MVNMEKQMTLGGGNLENMPDWGFMHFLGDLTKFAVVMLQLLLLL